MSLFAINTYHKLHVCTYYELLMSCFDRLMKYVNNKSIRITLNVDATERVRDISVERSKSLGRWHMIDPHPPPPTRYAAVRSRALLICVINTQFYGPLCPLCCKGTHFVRILFDVIRVLQNTLSCPPRRVNLFIGVATHWHIRTNFICSFV